MPLRNWLLTGTSLTLLALVPIASAHAQDAKDPALVAAYAAFQADPSDANRSALNEACIAAGFQSLDDCIAAITGQAPVESAPSDASSTPAEPASSAEAPASDTSSAMTPPSSEEPAPVSSSSEAAPPAETSSSAAPAPSSAVGASSAPADTTSSEMASSSAPADTTSSLAPSSSGPADETSGAPSGALDQLTAAVAAFNTAVSQNDTAAADAAMAQITALCTSAGFADVPTCLAQFGLTLNAPASDMSSASDQGASSSAPASDMPQASETVDPNAVEVLPPDVASEAAPILDSAKDQQNAASQPSSEAPPADASSASSSVAPPSSAAPSEQPAPPPQTDADAQASLQPPPDQQAVITEDGQRKGADFVFVQPPPPQNVEVINTPRDEHGGIVFKIGVNIYINNTTETRDRLYDRKRGDEIYYEDLSRGRTREVIVRRDGTRIITIYDRYGDVLQRSKVLTDGRTIILATYDPRHEDDLANWRDPGEDLPPLVLTIPASQYILDADTADEEQVQVFLSQPPVERVQRIYTIDEVKRSARLRDSVRRLEIGDLTFATGKATISRDQVGSLATVAKAMQQLLAKNPGEVFLIEGHTDAVGSNVTNLVLSDQRAATVARILTDFYDIPAENLVTQGYGERYLKVKTEGPEELNRRVTVKRITPLVTYETANK